MQRLEERLDLVDLEARERDADVGRARRRSARSPYFSSRCRRSFSASHALHLDAHEVAAVERVHVPALAEARRVRDLVDLLGARAQHLVLLLALGVDRRGRERLLDERCESCGAVRDPAADRAARLRVERVERRLGSLGAAPGRSVRKPQRRPQTNSSLVAPSSFTASRFGWQVRPAARTATPSASARQVVEEAEVGVVDDHDQLRARLRLRAAARRRSPRPSAGVGM